MTARVARSAGSAWLIAGGVLSAVAALLHVAIIVGGPDWYLFFGAGAEFADADAAGRWWPALVTLGIAAVLATWAAYAFSGAGRLPRLPLLRTGLVVITAIYLTRAILFPTMAALDDGISRFNFWSSSTVLVYGLCYAIGTRRAWPALSKWMN